jgi:hypothetical protein
MPRRVFISHKVKDRAAAEDIKSALDHRAAGNFEIFISERIEAGEEWNKAILDNLEKADWLLLLYTDPSEEWDWCLFEAGFFAHRAKDVEGRLVCLHKQDVRPPTPLQRWQSVPVTDGATLENFLKDLYSGINDFIDKTLVQRPDKLRRLAKEIADAFSRGGKKSCWYTQYVTLSMNADQVQELERTGTVPTFAQCGVEERESLDIFGRGTGKCTMGTLQEGLDIHYKERWLKSLGQTLQAASLGRRPPRISVLYSKSLQKDYYVSLHRLDRFSDGSLGFCLVFVEKIAEDDKEQEPRLQSVGDMLKLGRAFRWQILTKFYREFSVLKNRRSPPEDIKECLERLNWSLNWVIGESQRLNILTGDDVIASFEDEKVKKELSDACNEVWPGLFRALREGSGNLDIDKVCDALAGMLRLNKEYMIQAAGRYQELLREMP